jgi:fatty acid desaturase
MEKSAAMLSLLLSRNETSLAKWRPSEVFVGWTVVLIVAWKLGILIPLLVLWFLPMVTITEAIVRLRNIAEHFGLPDRELLHPTRTVVVKRLESWALGMHNANFHVEHHLFPSVPLSRLPQLRALLIANDEFVAGTHTTNGYFNVLRESAAQTERNNNVRESALLRIDRRNDRW